MGETEDGFVVAPDLNADLVLDHTLRLFQGLDWLRGSEGADAELRESHRQNARRVAAAALGSLEMMYERVPKQVERALSAVLDEAEGSVFVQPCLDEAVDRVAEALHVPVSELEGMWGPLSYPNCPLCGDDLAHDVVEAAFGLFEPTCPSLHIRTVGKEWYWCATSDQYRRLAWFGATRYHRGMETTISPGSVSPEPGVFPLADVESVAPKTIGARQDEFLLTLAALARGKSGVATYLPLRKRDAPLVMGSQFRDLLYHIVDLTDQGLVEQEDEYTGGGETRVRVTPTGWKRVEALETGTVEKPNQGFVAMWFDAKLEPIYRRAIGPAIEAAGYEPMQMAFVEHNDDINDRIIAEIRKSRFVVADFTGNRGGVYFEAGFALGLGKPVIWTCERSFFEESGVHFDTQARNHILWDSAEGLRASLQARIEATIPREA